MSISPRPASIQPRAINLLRACIAVQEVYAATPEADIAGRQRLDDIRVAIQREIGRLEGSDDHR